jgi:hypothetical protein
LISAKNGNPLPVGFAGGAAFEGCVTFGGVSSLIACNAEAGGALELGNGGEAAGGGGGGAGGALDTGNGGALILGTEGALGRGALGNVVIFCGDNVGTGGAIGVADGFLFANLAFKASANGFPVGIGADGAGEDGTGVDLIGFCI